MDSSKKMNSILTEIAQRHDINSGKKVNDPVEFLSKQWFKNEAHKYLSYEDESNSLYDEFRDLFGESKIEELSGNELLEHLFLGKDVEWETLCHALEFTKKYERFGGIRGSSAAKYGLYFKKEKNSWVKGKGKNVTTFDLDHAIEHGTKIRDELVIGSKIISEINMNDPEGYRKAYSELVSKTPLTCGKIWTFKYYHMLYPDRIPNFYADSSDVKWLSAISQLLGLERDATDFICMGEIAKFVANCGISNIVFSQIIAELYRQGYIASSPEDESAGVQLEPEITLAPRTDFKHALNTILYGAPGTGKTYSSAEYATAIVEKRDLNLSNNEAEKRKALMQKYREYVQGGYIVFTTFHQSYGYEDFIQGIRPNVKTDSLSFRNVDGVFKEIADKAKKEPDKNYVIIIDEINRGNISKIFGELITLIEEDKRLGEINGMTVKLPSGELFSVPNNLYIIGTMNSADKSISLIDAALRRRFAFVEMRPNKQLITNPLFSSVFSKLNDALFHELQSTDLLIGHSYFMNKENSDFCNTMNNNIIPLLYEYLFDDRRKVQRILGEVLKGIDYEIEDEHSGRLKVVKKKQ